MRFTVSRQDLLKTLSHVVPIAERKSTIPILSNLKVEAGNELLFTATNTDIETIEKVPAQIAEEGKTTVPAHVLYDIVKKLPEGELSFSMQDSQMIISAGRARFALPCLPADDFPMMAGAPLQFRFKVSPDDLVALIDKTKFAISNEETRYYLNGIYLHTVEVKGQQILRAAASDGFRLSLYDIPAPEGSKGMPGVIVPKQVIGELRKLIDDASEDITVEVSETKTRFSFEQAIMTSKLIDGKYPNYSAIIPKGNDKILSVNTALFKEAVDRVSSVSVDKFRSVKLSLNKNTLVLSASTPEAGSGTEQLEANYVGEKLEAVFRYKQILDMTYQIETDEIHLLFSDGTSPVIMKEKDNDHFIYVLMPLRL